MHDSTGQCSTVSRVAGQRCDVQVHNDTNTNTEIRALHFTHRCNALPCPILHCTMQYLYLYRMASGGHYDSAPFNFKAPRRSTWSQGYICLGSWYSLHIKNQQLPSRFVEASVEAVKESQASQFQPLEQLDAVEKLTAPQMTA